MPYVGRFAPSPTGPLHMGSLLAALGSYLHAKSQSGLWLLRIEDLDPPRERPGADRLIIQALQAHGLQWDGNVLYQSQRLRYYQQAIDQLLAAEHAFVCKCSRKDLAQTHGRHLGKCAVMSADETLAVRVSVGKSVLAFNDELQGGVEQDLAAQVGDFVIKRRDGLYAYQLAVVLDDAFQQVTHVVRGTDLLESTSRQVFLQQKLGLATPNYCHLPLLVNKIGDKLSKQNMAASLDLDAVLENIRYCLQVLGLSAPPYLLTQDSPRALLEWAVQHWPRCVAGLQNVTKVTFVD